MDGTTTVEISPKGGTVIVHVPITFRKRNGRKQMVGPDGPTNWAPARPKVDSTLVKALARSFRWYKHLESGRYASIEEMANAERINPSYLGRVLRLSLLAPAIVEDLLDGRNPNLPLAKLLKPFPTEWSEQERWAAKSHG
jgi:hypothetical protein